MGTADGQLLIAGPTLLDPNFWRTVVLVIQHDDEGAFGLVLNRPADTTIGESVPAIDEVVDGDEPLFIGGPVRPSSRREDAFSQEPRELWSVVLSRKGGSYALVARLPADPSVN